MHCSAPDFPPRILGPAPRFLMSAEVLGWSTSSILYWPLENLCCIFHLWFLFGKIKGLALYQNFLFSDKMTLVMTWRNMVLRVATEMEVQQQNLWPWSLGFSWNPTKISVKFLVLLTAGAKHCVAFASWVIWVLPGRDRQVPKATPVLRQEDGASLGNQARGLNFPLERKMRRFMGSLLLSQVYESHFSGAGHMVAFWGGTVWRDQKLRWVAPPLPFQHVSSLLPSWNGHINLSISNWGCAGGHFTTWNPWNQPPQLLCTTSFDVCPGKFRLSHWSKGREKLFHGLFVMLTPSEESPGWRKEKK